MYVIKILGRVDGLPCPFEDTYVKSVNFEAFGGCGHVKTTPRFSRAKLFATYEEAFAFWNTVPNCRATRPDGNPNKPLTAYSVIIAPGTDG